MGDQKIEIAPEKKPTIDEVIFRLDEKIRTATNPVESKKIIRAELQPLPRSQLELLQAEIRRGSDVLAVARSPEQNRAVHESIDQEVRSRLPQVQQDGQEGEVDSWSPQTKQRMEAVGWGVGIGVTVVGLALLWRATKKKVVETAKATEEKAGWLWGKLKWVLGLGAAGVLGYVGIRAFQEFRSLASLTNELEKAKKEFAKLSAKPKEMMDAAEAKLLEATEKKVQALEQAVAEFKKKGEKDLEEKIPTKEVVKKKAKDTVGAVKGIANQTIENPQVKEKAEKAEEIGKEVLLAKVILSQSTTQWTGLTAVPKENQIVDLLRKKGGDTMNSIENTSDPFGIKNSNDKENRKIAGDIVMNYCTNQREKISEAIMKEKKCDENEADRTIGEMSLSTYLDYALKNSDSYLMAMIELEKAPKNLAGLSDSLQNLDYKKILGNDDRVEKILGNILDEIKPEDLGMTQKDLDGISATDILVAILALTHGTALVTQTSLSSKKDATPTEKIIGHILSSLTAEGNTTHKAMLPFFHGVFPTTEKGKSPEQQVKTYLLERMPAADALRFYLYHRMLSGGNAVAIPLMQVDVIRFIAKHDSGNFLKLKTKKYEATTNVVKSIATNGGRQIMKEWKEYGLNFNVEMTEKEEKMLKQVGTKINDILIEGASEAGAGYVGVFESLMKDPRTYYYTAALGVAEATGIRVFSEYSDYLSDPKRFHELLGHAKGTVNPAKKLVAPMETLLSKIRYTTESKNTAIHAYQVVYDPISKIADDVHFKEADRLLRKCIASPRMASRWAALSDYLQTIAGTDKPLLDAAAKAAEIAGPTGAKIRGVFHAFRVPLKVIRGKSALGITANLLLYPARFAGGVVDRMNPLGKTAGALKNSFSALHNDESSGIRAKSRIPETAVKSADAVNPAVTRSVDASIQTANGKVVDMEFKPHAGPSAEPVGVGAVQDKPTMSRATSAAVETTGKIQDFATVKRGIDAARNVGNTAEVGRLVTENKTAIQAAVEAGDTEAKALLNAVNFAKKWTTGKVVMTGLPFIGTAIDAYLIRANEHAIAEAMKAGDLQKVSELKSERASLVSAGAGGLLWAGAETAGVMGFGNGAALALPSSLSGGALGMTVSGLATGTVLATLVIPASFYKEAIKESVAEWKKSEQEYAVMSGVKLLAEIRKKMTERTTGTAAANGDRYIQSLVVGTPERYQKKFDDTEKNINRPMREKMYGAYFMKYTQAPWTDSDTVLAEKKLEASMKQRTNVSDSERKELSDSIVKDIAKQRFNQAVADKRHFIEFISITGEGFSSAQPQELVQADDYAEVRSIYRDLLSKGQKPELKYTDALGAEKTLDLSAFRFEGEPSPAEKSSIRTILKQYRKEVKIPTLFREQSLTAAVSKEFGDEKTKNEIREKVLSQFRHNILRADELIETYGDEGSQLKRGNVWLIRAELRREFEAQYDQFISKIDGQIHSPEEYQSWLQRMEDVWSQALDIESLLKKANAFLPKTQKQEINQNAAPGSVKNMNYAKTFREKEEKYGKVLRELVE